METRYLFLKAARVGLVILILAVSVSRLIGRPVLAACSTALVPTGSSQLAPTVPVAGTYRLWSRIKAPDNLNNSYSVQIDSGCPLIVEATMVANTWTWIDYPMTMALTAGTHSLALQGLSSSIYVDRVILTTDATCQPTGTGDNCAPQGPAPGDINGDGKVNIFDLSVLLSQWGTASPVADLNKDGAVNIYDLSIMLTHWTG